MHIKNSQYSFTPPMERSSMAPIKKDSMDVCLEVFTHAIAACLIVVTSLAVANQIDGVGAGSGMICLATLALFGGVLLVLKQTAKKRAAYFSIYSIFSASFSYSYGWIGNCGNITDCHNWPLYIGSFGCCNARPLWCGLLWQRECLD